MTLGLRSKSRAPRRFSKRWIARLTSLKLGIGGGFTRLARSLLLTGSSPELFPLQRTSRRQPPPQPLGSHLASGRRSLFYEEISPCRSVVLAMQLTSLCACVGQSFSVK